MKARGVRSSQPGGPNITTPLVLTASSEFTPNSYPFKYKVHLIAAGSSGGAGGYSSTANTTTYIYASGGGSGSVYISSSTQTLSSGSLTFAIGAAPLTSVRSVGGSTTVTRNDNAAIEAAWNTAFTVAGVANYNGGNGASGGGASGRYVVNNANGTENVLHYQFGYGGYSGGQGVNTNVGTGGTGISNTGGAQAGNDSKIPRGGNGYAGNAQGTLPPSYAGIVISGTTYFAGSNYGKGADGANGGTNTPDNFGIAGAGVAVLEPIP
jgi:hypothetical protein